MCGISGYFGQNRINPKDYYKAHLLLRHRGPDDEGFVLNSESNITFASGDDTVEELRTQKHIGSFGKTDLILGHRRLSIIDLSAKGHQPMTDPSNRYYLVYNGEIYNYVELREELVELGYNFVSQSDTEVFLYAYIEWKEECFNRFNGMWAAAIYDSHNKQLILTRDRFGIKPLYYYLKNGNLCFASEVKFILHFMDHREIAEDLAIGYVLYSLQDHSAETLFKGVYELEPGKYAVFRNNSLVVTKYWRYLPRINNKLTLGDTSKLLDDLFTSSLDLRMRSDVPVGSLLSGGLDSTLIVCNISSKYRSKIERFQTFSAVYKEELWSEEDYIEQTIERTGYIPNYIYPNPDKFVECFDRLLYHQEFPLHTLTVYAQWCVYEYVSRNSDVIVLLNGQGCDEIFGGYMANYYSLLAEKLRRIQLGRFLVELLLLKRHREKSYVEILKHTLDILLDHFSVSVTGIFGDKAGVCVGRDGGLRNKIWRKSKERSVSRNIFLQDLFSSLTVRALREYLRHEDRNSMAFSLETRLPFLDYRIVELGYSLPDDFKIEHGVNKRIVRHFARQYCPLDVVNRKDKMGFPTPQSVWSRTVLRDEMGRILGNRKLLTRDLDFLDADRVMELYRGYVNGKNNEYPLLWRIYFLARWRSMWIDREGVV